MINQGLRVRAAGVMVRDGHVLMESLRGAEQWSPIGGGVEPGELIEEAVVREFEEEIGWNVAVQRIALVTDDIFPGGDLLEHAIAFFALVEGGPGEGCVDVKPATTAEEHMEMRWIPISALDRFTLLPPSLAYELPAVLGNDTIIRSMRRG